MKIHVYGAGNVGGNIIRAAARAGHTVTVGVRDPSKYDALLQETGATASDSAEGADIVINTMPHGVAAALLPGAGLANTVLIDASNVLTWSGGPVHAPPVGFTSGAARRRF